MPIDDVLNRRRFLGGTAAAGAVLATGGIASAAFAPASVNIINTGANDSFALQALAKDQRLFEKYNLNANTQNVSDGIKLTAAIVTGASDVGILTGFGQVFPAIENGAKLKIIGAAMLLPDFAVYTANPAIKTLKDLEGKSVGTGAVGALVWAVMAGMLKKAGVDLNKVTFVNIGSSSDVFKAVVAKKVDAGPAQHDFVKVASQYGVRVIADAVKELPLFTNQGTFTSDRAIAQKRDALVRTLAIYGSMYRYVDLPASKEPYVKAYVEGVGPGTEAAGRDRWEWFSPLKGYNRDIAMTIERVNYMQQLNVSLGIQKSILPFDQVADMSIARDAVRLLGAGKV
jgi:ABC-type nitrate/sulfonate/bicarbonate transport system substrate-binding protein